jgi:hypothetical protein
MPAADETAASSLHSLQQKLCMLHQLLPAAARPHVLTLLLLLLLLLHPLPSTISSSSKLKLL